MARDGKRKRKVVPDDEWDPTGYYRRKAEKEGEQLDGCLWITAVWLGVSAITGIVQCSRAEAHEVGDVEPRLCEEGSPDERCTIYDQSTVWTMTGQERTLKWSEHPADKQAMDLEYEVEAFRFPPKANQLPIKSYRLPEGTNVAKWKPMLAGHYWMRARACRTDTENATDIENHPDAEKRPDGTWIICSAWSKSMDPANTDPEKYPRGFIVFVELAPATGGGIE